MFATRRWLDMRKRQDWFDMRKRLKKSTLTTNTPTDHPLNDQQPEYETAPKSTENHGSNLNKWGFETRDGDTKFKWQYLMPGYPFLAAWKCLRADENFSLFRWLGLSLWGEFLKFFSYVLCLVGLYWYFDKNINTSPFPILIMGIISYPLLSYLSKAWIENNYHGKNPFYFP